MRYLLSKNGGPYIDITKTAAQNFIESIKEEGRAAAALFAYDELTGPGKKIFRFLFNAHVFRGGYTDLACALQEKISYVSNIRKACLALEERGLIVIGNGYMFLRDGWTSYFFNRGTL